MKTLILTLLISFSSISFAGADCYVGEVSYFPYYFTPEGFLEANGAEMYVTAAPALFSLIGNKFGGISNYTFKLPNIPPIKTVEGVEIKAYICMKGYYPTREQ